MKTNEQADALDTALLLLLRPAEEKDQKILPQQLTDSKLRRELLDAFFM